jgi:hypothetical protein
MLVVQCSFRAAGAKCSLMRDKPAGAARVLDARATVFAGKDSGLPLAIMILLVLIARRGRVTIQMNAVAAYHRHLVPSPPVAATVTRS